MAEKFTAEERAAMKERAAEAKANKKREESTADVLAKIASMQDTDRVVAQALHEVVTEVAPGLVPKTWYGMPAYADVDGKIVVFFQDATKFKTRYSTVGFQDAAKLDEGEMWATAYAVTKATPAVRKELARLVRKAVG